MNDERMNGDNTGEPCTTNPASPREVQLIQLHARLDRALAQIERGVRCLAMHYVDVNDREDLRRWLRVNRGDNVGGP